MGGRHNRDLNSIDEPRDVTRAVGVDGDALAAADSLAVHRRLAQESNKANPSRFQGRQARRHAKQLRRREQRRASVRRTETPQPAHSLSEPSHTANWCPVEQVNILLPAGRTCPACHQTV